MFSQLLALSKRPISIHDHCSTCIYAYYGIGNRIRKCLSVCLFTVGQRLSLFGDWLAVVPATQRTTQWLKQISGFTAVSIVLATKYMCKHTYATNNCEYAHYSWCTNNVASLIFPFLNENKCWQSFTVHKRTNYVHRIDRILSILLMMLTIDYYCKIRESNKTGTFLVPQL